MTGRIEAVARRKVNYLVLLPALLVSLLCGWGWLLAYKPLEYLGFVGVLAMVIVSGPHGSAGVIGGTLFLVVNTVTYYGLFWVILRVIGVIRTLRR